MARGCGLHAYWQDEHWYVLHRAIGGNDIVSISGTFVRTVAGEPVVGVAV